MSRTWEKEPFPHVQSYPDPKRPKYGRKFDRYYRARFRVGGTLHVVTFGWMSEGWTARSVYDKACEYKANIKSGKRPTSWKEEQQLNLDQAKVEEAQRKAELLQTLTFKEYFDHHYLPGAEANKKPETIRMSMCTLMEPPMCGIMEPLVG